MNQVGIYRLTFKTVDGRKKPISFTTEITAAIQPESWIAEEKLYIDRALDKCIDGKAVVDKFKETKPNVTFIREVPGLSRPELSYKSVKDY